MSECLHRRCWLWWFGHYGNCWRQESCPIKQIFLVWLYKPMQHTYYVFVWLHFSQSTNIFYKNQSISWVGFIIKLISQTKVWFFWLQLMLKLNKSCFNFNINWSFLFIQKDLTSFWRAITWVAKEEIAIRWPLEIWILTPMFHNCSSICIKSQIFTTPLTII